MSRQRGTTGRLTDTGDRYQEWLEVFESDSIPLISPLYEIVELPERGAEPVYHIDIQKHSARNRERVW